MDTVEAVEELKSLYDCSLELEKKTRELLKKLYVQRVNLGRKVINAIYFCPICGNNIDPINDRKYHPYRSWGRTWQCKTCKKGFGVKILNEKTLSELKSFWIEKKETTK